MCVDPFYEVVGEVFLCVDPLYEVVGEVFCVCGSILQGCR